MSVELIPAMQQSPRATTEVSVAAWLKMPAACMVLSLLGLAGGMFVWRRLAGALLEPLDAWALAVTAAVLAAAALTIRVLGRGYPSGGVSLRPWVAVSILFGPTAALAAAGFSLSLPGTSPAGLATFWGVLAIGELTGLLLGRFAAGSATHLMARVWQSSKALPAMFKSLASGKAVVRRLRFDAAHEPSTRAAEQSPSQPDTCAVSQSPTFEQASDGQITQQVVRQQASDGTETMSGRLRASFLPGQRTASVHLAFCPPFANMPTVEVKQIDGPPGRIKTVQLLPYGARFDLKLSEDAAEPLAVLLQFSARA